MRRLFFTTIVMLSLLTTATFADVQTLTLNTGFNHDANQKYGVDVKDDYWTLYYDQMTVPVRLADTMGPYAGAWKGAMDDSQWIAFAPKGLPINNNKPSRTYVFQKCFCLKPGFEREDNLKNLMLQLKLRADDWAGVYLNENIADITTPSPVAFSWNPPKSILNVTPTAGGFSNIVPAELTLNGRELLRKLRVGKNCLQVRLDDLGLVVSGFNLTGHLTAAGIDGVAKGTEPRTMFSNCSSCAREVKTTGPKIETRFERTQN